MNSKPLISVVCPVFNEEQAIPIFYQRIRSVFAGLEHSYRFELLFTNNSSTDGTLNILEGLRALDSSIKVLTFSRNFGYQASVLAGLFRATGTAIAVIDVDCEDPPEMLPTFLEHFEAGYDVVYGIRGNRPEPSVVTFLRRTFYRLMRGVADSDIILDMAEFCLMSSRVRDQVVRNANTFPFIRGEIAYTGFRRFGVRYDRQSRVTGITHYNFFGMALFGLAGILTVSTFPFRFAAYLLPFVMLINALALLAVFLLADPSRVFFATALLDCSLIIFLISIFGLYIARIYKNGISRPVYIVDESRSSLE